jgi:hypothetical protein
MRLFKGRNKKEGVSAKQVWRVWRVVQVDVLADIVKCFQRDGHHGVVVDVAKGGWGEGG